MDRGFLEVNSPLCVTVVGMVAALDRNPRFESAHTIDELWCCKVNASTPDLNA